MSIIALKNNQKLFNRKLGKLYLVRAAYFLEAFSKENHLTFDLMCMRCDVRFSFLNVKKQKMMNREMSSYGMQSSLFLSVPPSLSLFICFYFNICLSISFFHLSTHLTIQLFLSVTTILFLHLYFFLKSINESLDVIDARKVSKYK